MLRAAQVHVAIFQAHFLGDVHGLFHGEGRRARFVQDPDLFGKQLHLAGGQIRIDGVRAAQGDGTFDRDHILRAHLLGFAVRGLVRIGANGNLGDAFAVAQVDEDHAAEIAVAVNPAHQQGARAGVRGAQLAAGVSTPQVAEKIKFRFHKKCRAS